MRRKDRSKVCRATSGPKKSPRGPVRNICFTRMAAYLESLKRSYKDSADGAEIVADIEARIAELILSAQDLSLIHI